MMNDAGNAELRRLIENEISLGFTFAQTALLAGSKEHREQGFENAKKAYATARRFIARLPGADTNSLWQVQLSKLRDILDGRSSDARSQLSQKPEKIS